MSTSLAAMHACLKVLAPERPNPLIQRPLTDLSTLHITMGIFNTQHTSFHMVHRESISPSFSFPCPAFKLPPSSPRPNALCRPDARPPQMQLRRPSQTPQAAPQTPPKPSTYYSAVITSPSSSHSCIEPNAIHAFPNLNNLV